jgi:hypothetical protein
MPTIGAALLRDPIRSITRSPLAFGNTSRTSPDLRGLGSRDFDASLFKRVYFKEAANVEFRMEAFNAFNHPVWNGPGTTVNTPGAFGVVNTKGGQRRQVQLALRIQS